MNIRVVCPNDLQILQEISRSTFIQSFGPVNKVHNMDAYTKVAFSKEKLRKELVHPSSQFFFAELKNEIAGYLKLNRDDAQTEPMGEFSMEIERIYVRSNHQGLGLGKQLIEFAKTKGFEANMKMLWLGVWEENHRALQFYRNSGFEDFDTHLFTFGDEEQQDLLLRFSLE